MKIGILFAGQGSQHSGMGKDFYDRFPAARAVYDRVHIDIDVKKLCFEGTQEELNDTAVAQPCILTTSSAIAAVLSENGIHADAIAGLSLGEYLRRNRGRHWFANAARSWQRLCRQGQAAWQLF